MEWVEWVVQSGWYRVGVGVGVGRVQSGSGRRKRVVGGRVGGTEWEW